MPDMPAVEAPATEAAPPAVETPIGVPPDQVDTPPLAEPTAEEKAAAAAAKEAKPKADAIFRSAKKRERELVDKQQAFNAERQRWESDRQTHVQGEVARQVAEALKEFRADPIGFAEKNGFDKQTIAGRLLNDGKQSPEEIARAAQARVEALEKQYQERQQNETRERNERLYIEHIRANAEKYPHAVEEWGDADIVGETYKLIAEIHAEHRRKNETIPVYQDAEIAEYLDRRAKKRQSQRQERIKARGAQVTAKDAAQAAPKVGATGNGTEAGKPASAPTTLTGRLSSERQTIAAKDFLDMSEEEQRAAIDAEVAKAAGLRRTA